MRLSSVKELSHVILNIMALFIVLPLAIAVIAFMNVANVLHYSTTLAEAGSVSYEIYLVYVFTFGIVRAWIVWICVFVVDCTCCCLAFDFEYKEIQKSK